MPNNLKSLKSKISNLQACIIGLLLTLIGAGLKYYNISVPGYILIAFGVVGIPTIFIWNYFKHRTSIPAHVQDIAPDNVSQESEEPLPDFIMAESVEKLREKQGVRPMRDTENELSLYHIPKGVFGWVESYKLNSPLIWTEDSLFGQDHRVLPMSAKLSQKRRYTNEVEIHKSDTGTVNVVVFVSDETRIRLEDPSRKDAIGVVVVFRLYKNYHQPIAIPRERLTYWESRSFGDNEPVADVWVA